MKQSWCWHSQSVHLLPYPAGNDLLHLHFDRHHHQQQQQQKVMQPLSATMMSPPCVAHHHHRIEKSSPAMTSFSRSSVPWIDKPRKQARRPHLDLSNDLYQRAVTDLAHLHGRQRVWSAGRDEMRRRQQQRHCILPHTTTNSLLGNRRHHHGNTASNPVSKDTRSTYNAMATAAIAVGFTNGGERAPSTQRVAVGGAEIIVGCQQRHQPTNCRRVFGVVRPVQRTTTAAADTTGSKTARTSLQREQGQGQGQGQSEAVTCVTNKKANSDEESKKSADEKSVGKMLDCKFISLH